MFQPRSLRKKVPKEPKPLFSATNCLEHFEQLNRPNAMIFRKRFAIDYFDFNELQLYKYTFKTFASVSSFQNKVL